MEHSAEAGREILTAPELISSIEGWPAMVRRIDRACQTINEVLAVVRAEQPEACLYLDGSQTLHLMSGAPHDDPCEDPRHDRIMYSARLEAGGGDW